MGVVTGVNSAGADKEVATQALNAELQDKGFLLTSTEDIINWGADWLAALDDLWFGVLCCGNDPAVDAALRSGTLWHRAARVSTPV